MLVGVGAVVYLGDCRDVLADMANDSIDAIIGHLDDLSCPFLRLVGVRTKDLNVANSSALAATLVLLGVLELRRRRPTGVWGSLTALDGPTELQR